jgi:hypothetical protein
MILLLLFNWHGNRNYPPNSTTRSEATGNEASIVVSPLRAVHFHAGSFDADDAGGIKHSSRAGHGREYTTILLRRRQDDSSLVHNLLGLWTLHSSSAVPCFRTEDRSAVKT